ncbi:MAG TPA: hypothetical protein VN955_09625 [Gemmatimonadales bacterium]|nr:hypothetical protein [Gemmatimonadales bacterium]
MPDAKLQELAQRLGVRAAERLDVERTAQAVVTRLRETPRASVVTRLWMQPAWLKLAATVVLLLGAGAVTRGLWRPPGSAAAGEAAAALNELTTDQLQQLLEIVDQPTDEAAPLPPADASLDDLTAPQLRELLRSLEG